MISGAIWLLVWAAGIFVASIVILVYAIRFLRTSRKALQETEITIRQMEIDVQRGYNRIATLPVQDLHVYLSNIFSKALELGNDREISKNDPDAKLNLYAIASADVYTILGPDTCAAIAYFYGEKYLGNWLYQSYQILEKRGIIMKLIDDKSTKAEAIEKAL